MLGYVRLGYGMLLGEFWVGYVSLGNVFFTLSSVMLC